MTTTVTGYTIINPTAAQLASYIQSQPGYQGFIDGLKTAYQLNDIKSYAKACKQTFDSTYPDYETKIHQSIATYIKDNYPELYNDCTILLDDGTYAFGSDVIKNKLQYASEDVKNVLNKLNSSLSLVGDAISIVFYGIEIYVMLSIGSSLIYNISGTTADYINEQKSNMTTYVQNLKASVNAYKQNVTEQLENYEAETQNEAENFMDGIQALITDYVPHEYQDTVLGNISSYIARQKDSINTFVEDQKQVIDSFKAEVKSDTQEYFKEQYETIYQWYEDRVSQTMEGLPVSSTFENDQDIENDINKIFGDF